MVEYWQERTMNKELKKAIKEYNKTARKIKKELDLHE